MCYVASTLLSCSAYSTLQRMQTKARATNRLRELRKAADTKLYEVAAVVRADTSTIHRWETGQSPIPDESKAQLAELFGVTRAYLMGWDEDEKRSGDVA